MIHVYNKVLNCDNKCITGEVGMLEPEQFEKLCEGLINVIENNVEGDVVEFGTYIGEAAKMLMRTITLSKSNKKLYCYDSFEGLPSLSKWEENTGWKSGTLKTTMDVLIKNFEVNDLPIPIIHKNFFCDIPENKIPEKISFAFLDGDFYVSILDSLEKIYDRISDGGYIFFHDYKRPDLPGVDAAIKDFLKSRNLDYNVIEVSNGLGLMVKNRQIKKQEEIFKIETLSEVKNPDITLVTGFWGFSKRGNELESYIRDFKKLLTIKQNLIIYIPKNFEYLVWENRHKKNTLVQHYNLEDIKKIYNPFWEKTQQVKKNIQISLTNDEYEFKNEISISKMFIFHDSVIWNPFNCEYFYWIEFDSITSNLYESDFNEIKKKGDLFSISDDLTEKTKKEYELNGFSFENMCNFIGLDIKTSYKSDLFGGKKESISLLNGEYYSTFNDILNKKNIGVINNILTIIFNRKDNKYLNSNNNNYSIQTTDDVLFNLIKKYDCDKITSGYHYIYTNLFESIRNRNLNYLEIGLGTLLNVESSHVGTLSIHPNFKPSSILKVWKEYFINSNIYGIDIADDCMVNDDRIKTFLVSSIDKQKCDDVLGDLRFDIILDDGNHTADSQFKTFENFFHRLNNGGYYIIEDIGGGGDGVSFYVKYKNELKKIINNHEYFLDWNILCIRKNNSGRGCHFGNFLSDVEFIYNGGGFKSFMNEEPPNKNISHSFYEKWSIDSEDTNTNNDKNLLKESFQDIYQNWRFGGWPQSKSGPGSTIKETMALSEKIKELVKEKDIKIVVDIPCGDFNWMKTIAYDFHQYIGGDIVPEIKKDNEKYVTSNVDFIEIDLTETNVKIPDGDLLIVRDLLGHLSLDEGKKVLNNILKSNCKYLLTTTWYNINDENYHISHVNEGNDVSLEKVWERGAAGFYAPCLESEPFNFPKPEFYLEESTMVHGYENGNRKGLAFYEIQKLKELKFSHLQIKDNIEIITKKVELTDFNMNKNLTIVTGLWNIGRPGRDFSHYIEHFKNFLDIPQNLFIYIPAEYEYLVWEKRSKENTFVKIYELEDIKNLYSPFWDKTHEIRNNSNWLNQAGWLSGSPQAVLEYYNPIVQSKMFMLNDASIWNPFNTEYFFWLDAGITNTVPHSHFVENNVLDKLTEIGNPFLFLSYPYEANTEIHGFTFSEMNKIARTKVEYVCRGGLFGGHKQQINEANATYYSLLTNTINTGYMGTEESIFTLMSYLEPHIYKRFELDGNGLIVKFTQAVIDNNVKIAESKVASVPQNFIKYTDRDVEKVKTNLYILTFNFPEQVLHTIESMKKTPEWLTKLHLVLLDNSTTEEVRNENRKIAEDYNFEYISLEGNTGICGGRQAAAEHFHDSDADFMFFFEDDMTSNPPEYEGQFCRNGFRKYIPNLYNLVHRIMLKEKFDFLKLSFTEVYFDNDKQCSWYNVPQHIRTRDWPHYDKLPVTGLDPNAPLTNFKNIGNVDGLTYISGEIYYANWPMIVSKEGNYKMFIETKWAHPFEQTWMSYIYQLTKEGKINPALLLASPIWHDRIKHYQPNERREN